MWKVNTKQFFSWRIYMKIELQEGRNAFFLHLQHGRRDITCKQLRRSRLFIALQFDVLNKHILFSSSWTGGHFVCACVNKVCWSNNLVPRGPRSFWSATGIVALSAGQSNADSGDEIGPFALETSPKRIDREGLGKCCTGTRQGTPHYQLYPLPI